jgi:hypothetical protein
MPHLKLIDLKIDEIHGLIMKSLNLFIKENIFTDRHEILIIPPDQMIYGFHTDKLEI